MCGLIGSILWDNSNFEAAEEKTRRAMQTLNHRGPDSNGFYSSRSHGLILGHTRLSIFDLTETGHQPMKSGSGASQIIFNGAIYNYLELKKDLTGKGISFRGTSDTEVLLESLQEHGTDCLKEMRGMFALAYWDEKKQTLTLARDRVGKKPIYYSHTKEGFFFASEINTLASYIPPDLLDINPGALDDYLSWGYIGGESTIYKGIKCLPPGSFLTLNLEKQIQIKKYWQPKWKNFSPYDSAEVPLNIEKFLEEAIKIRLRADVPVGILLSGGIDSGLVTALAAKETNTPISTFCVGSENANFDERTPAREISRQFNTHHHEIVLKPDISGDLGKILFSYGQPFADASAIPSYYVSEFASHSVKVVLNGDGGDELFCGYRRHTLAYFLKYLAIGIDPLSTSTLAKGLLKFLPYPKGHRTQFSFLHRLLRVLASQGNLRYQILSSDGLNTEEKKGLYKNPNEYLNQKSEIQKLFDSLKPLKNLDFLLAADFGYELPYDLLVKMDIATMSHGLEARSPFLDSNLVEFALPLSSSEKIRGTQTKPILRSVAAKHLPASILNLPKRGFEIPLKSWLSNELKEQCQELLLNSSGIISEIFNKPAIENLLNNKQKKTALHSRWAQIVWNLFVLAHWDQKRRELINN